MLESTDEELYDHLDVFKEGKKAAVAMFGTNYGGTVENLTQGVAIERLKELEKDSG